MDDSRALKHEGRADSLPRFGKSGVFSKSAHARRSLGQSPGTCLCGPGEDGCDGCTGASTRLLLSSQGSSHFLSFCQAFNTHHTAQTLGLLGIVVRSGL